MNNQTIENEEGFTIIELLIATSILSVILVMASVMMTGIGRLYNKGISQSKIQSATRNITDDVSQRLQLDAQLSPQPTEVGGYNAYCIGETRYLYIIGKQLGDGNDGDGTPKVKPVLWRDKTPAGGCSSSNPDPSGVELVPTNARLIDFTITPTSPYQISIGLAYGDIDLLNVTPDNPNFNINTTCKGSNSTEYCATAKLTTSATRRITGE